MFDTSIATHNLGDYIINESINRELSELLENNYVVRYGTHTPIAKVYQQIIKPNRYIQEADYRFLCGTNIFATNLFRPVPNFNINLFDINIYRNSISLGCGVGQDKGSPNFTTYSKYIYKHILAKNVVHSVRDKVTADFLHELGFEAVNTGCPTLWQLNAKHCQKIPKKKSNKVVFTLTDYAIDEDADSSMLRQLLDNYEEIYLWIQGTGDLNYANRLFHNERVKIVPPSLEKYRQLLIENDIDYVGNRLHAGIFALQYMKRTIIVSVDHRAREMTETHNLPVIDRSNIKQLESMICAEITPDICIDDKLIKEWKSQFK